MNRSLFLTSAHVTSQMPRVTGVDKKNQKSHSIQCEITHTIDKQKCIQKKY